MTELLLQVDPAALSTAQQKGVDFYRRRVYTKAPVRKSHKLLLVAMLQEARLLGIKPYCGPATAWRVCVEYIYRPRTLRRKDFGAHKTTRPDLDNLTKSVLDALTESGLAFSDDSQVAALEMSKRYAWGFDRAPYIRLTFGPLN